MILCQALAKSYDLILITLLKKYHYYLLPINEQTDSEEMKQAVKGYPASKPESWIPEPTLVSIIPQLYRNPVQIYV